jgi:hypothetical protein
VVPAAPKVVRRAEPVSAAAAPEPLRAPVVLIPPAPVARQGTIERRAALPRRSPERTAAARTRLLAADAGTHLTGWNPSSTLPPASRPDAPSPVIPASAALTLVIPVRSGHRILERSPSLDPAMAPALPGPHLDRPSVTSGGAPSGDAPAIYSRGPPAEEVFE